MAGGRSCGRCGAGIEPGDRTCRRCDADLRTARPGTPEELARRLPPIARAESAARLAGPASVAAQKAAHRRATFWPDVLFAAAVFVVPAAAYDYLYGGHWRGWAMVGLCPLIGAAVGVAVNRLRGAGAPAWYVLGGLACLASEWTLAGFPPLPVAWHFHAAEPFAPFVLLLIVGALHGRGRRQDRLAGIA